MTPGKFEILRYVTPSGREPYTIWIGELKDRVGAALVEIHVNRIQFGHFGKSKPVGDLVWELKIRFGPGYRVYFLRDGAGRVVLLCGGDKRSQDRDIAISKNYCADYWRRR